MLPMLLGLGLATSGRREVWRHCEVCDDLAAMAPHVSVCETCAAAPSLSSGMPAADLTGGEGDE